MPMKAKVSKKRRRSSVKIKETNELKEAERQTEKLRIAGLLLRKLDISHVEILVAYDKFFKKYQNGEISKDDFLKENQENMMAETLFNVFDEDNSGTLNFYEFMMVKYTSNLQSPEEKLNWIFTAFDQDGGGSVDVDEIRGIVV